ncbi:MAG: YggT family protein [Burkholderiaceae bacterium]|nr:YggT family protein [Burkholderiaceae bacterium]MDO9089815.1 YggT family protein [Burkholderiaceae bacterium]
MLYNIVSLLLNVSVGLLGGACLLRLYMQQQRIGFGNPLGQVVMALSNWLVLPLRRVLPAWGKWDTASLVAAYLLQLVQSLVLYWMIAGLSAGVPLHALFGLAHLVLTGLMGLLIVYAILSWVQSRSPLTDVVERLCAPLLRPIRRFVPLVGGLDLSPLVLLVLLQVASIVLSFLQATALSAL